MLEKLGMPQIALAAARRGEAKMSDVETMTALAAADTLHEHRFRAYPPMSQQLLTYLNNRLAGLVDRDAVLSVKNGEWLNVVCGIMSKNKAEWEFLTWAHGLCIRAKAEGKARQIVDHCRGADRLNLPEGLFNKSREVQRMDSEQSRRELKG